MKFPKLKLTGLISSTKNKIPDAPTPIKEINKALSKFVGLKRQLSKDKNITKKYKV